MLDSTRLRPGEKRPLVVGDRNYETIQREIGQFFDAMTTGSDVLTEQLKLEIKKLSEEETEELTEHKKALADLQA